MKRNMDDVKLNYRRELRKLGYDAERGGFIGTCDDRADRWYVYEIPDQRTTIDRRGPGFATLQEAYTATRLEWDSNQYYGLAGN